MPADDVHPAVAIFDDGAHARLKPLVDPPVDDEAAGAGVVLEAAVERRQHPPALPVRHLCRPARGGERWLAQAGVQRELGAGVVHERCVDRGARFRPERGDEDGGRAGDAVARRLPEPLSRQRRVQQRCDAGSGERRDAADGGLCMAPAGQTCGLNVPRPADGQTEATPPTARTTRSASAAAAALLRRRTWRARALRRSRCVVTVRRRTAGVDERKIRARYGPGGGISLQKAHWWAFAKPVSIVGCGGTRDSASPVALE